MENTKILLVDDEEELLETLEVMLRDFNVTILKALSGQQALELIKVHHPDAIVTDLKMAPMNGLQLLDALKKLNYRIPVIMISAFWDKQKIIDAWHLGARNFIDKPFNSEQIISALKELLQGEPTNFQNRNKPTAPRSPMIPCQISISESTYLKIKHEADFSKITVAEQIERYLETRSAA